MLHVGIWSGRTPCGRHFSPICTTALGDFLARNELANCITATPTPPSSSPNSQKLTNRILINRKSFLVFVIVLLVSHPVNSQIIVEEISVIKIVRFHPVSLG